LPDFLPATARVRAEWRVAPAPQDCRTAAWRSPARSIADDHQRLNAPVRAFMADFEDSCSRPGENIIRGQVNLADAVRRSISYSDPATGKSPARRAHRDAHHAAARLYLPKHVRMAGGVRGAVRLRCSSPTTTGAGAPRPATLLPDGEPPGARLWNDVFVAAQEALGMQRGTIKATVLIETLLAAFEMDEILFSCASSAASTAAAGTTSSVSSRNSVTAMTACCPIAPP
jgi:malate synthase